MKKDVNLTRNCLNCERNTIGCEETCRFSLSESDELRPTLLGKRKAMKAEKVKAVKKATLLCLSADKNKGQKNLHNPPKRSYARADKNLQKQEDYRAKRQAKNKS